MGILIFSQGVRSLDDGKKQPALFLLIIKKKCVMSMCDYPPGEFQPRYLTQEEIDNPYLVIHELFRYGHLPQIREEFWVLLRAAATGDFSKVLTRREQSNLFSFYELMQKVIEANYLIDLQEKAAA